MFRFVSAFLTPSTGILLTCIDHPQHKTLDVISLFHKPSVPASLRVLTILKQASAHASETATEDQATDRKSLQNISFPPPNISFQCERQVVHQRSREISDADSVTRYTPKQASAHRFRAQRHRRASYKRSAEDNS